MDLANGIRSKVRILFLGQCLQYGYENVDRTSAFPNLTASMLRARFPGLSFKFDFKFLYHPLGLKTALTHKLFLSSPDVIVINLPAMFAATSWRVNVVYELAPELVDTARSFIHKIDAKLKGRIRPLGNRAMLDKAFAVRPPVSIGEYERLVEEAVEASRNTSRSRLVLMGPGRFNEDTIEDYAIHSPELWSSVNQMVLRVGKKLNVPVINAQEALAIHGGEVFVPRNHRWSEYGHEIVAREVEAVLALQVAELRSNKDVIA